MNIYPIMFNDVDKYLEKRQELNKLEESIINNCLVNLLSSPLEDLKITEYNLFLFSQSPSYFNSKEQIFLVVLFLEKFKDINIFKENLKKIISEEKLVDKNIIIKLNDKVINVLTKELIKLKDI